jgi:uncharacterized oligopeptide transporter (OPT) family protein
MADDPRIQKNLPENAYRELKPGETYVPMIPPDVSAPEITTRSIVFGLIMNVLFAVAATYLALKVGQGIETAIPISILAVGLSGFLLSIGLRRSTIIENINILAISTTSGMVAGGTVFTMPAIYLLDLPSKLTLGNPMIFLHIFLIPFFGAILGVIFLVPFRRYFVKEMHGKLPFPEGTATNEILVTGQTGGKGALILIYSFIVASIYTVGTAACHLWTETFTTGHLLVAGKKITAFPGDFWGQMTDKIKAVVSMGTGAEFLGLGFIIGVRYASIIMAGSLLSFLVITPLLGQLDIDALRDINPTFHATQGPAAEDHVHVMPAETTAQLGAIVTLSKAPEGETDEARRLRAETRRTQIAGIVDRLDAANISVGAAESVDVEAEPGEEGSWRLTGPSLAWLLKTTPDGVAVFPVEATAHEIFGNIPKNIGIGCIFTAGLLSILKMAGVIITALREALGSLFRKHEATAGDRTDQDISYPMLGLLGLAVTAAIAVYFYSFVFKGMEGGAMLTVWSVLLALGVSFIFITVSAWAIATISVTPISGMTVTTIIVTAVALMAAGLPKGPGGQLAVLLVGGVVASALSVAGTLVTEFKLGYWAGASPKRIQWSCILACLLASAVVTGTIMLLAWTRGFDPIANPDALQAPQANLMKSALDSFLGTGLVPWIPYGVGVVLALLLQLIGISPLAFGLGMYLPMELNMPILIGAVVAMLVSKGKADEATKKARNDKGIIIASGFIAGAAIVGVLLNGLGQWTVTAGWIEQINIKAQWLAEKGADPVAIERMLNWMGVVAFLVLCLFIFVDARLARPPKPKKVAAPTPPPES